MIHNPTAQMELQIDDHPPFIPDRVISVGNDLGTNETTEPTDSVRSFTPSSMVALAHYVYKGIEYKNYYRRGVWAAGSNDLPKFKVRELLAIEANK